MFWLNWIKFCPGPIAPRSATAVVVGGTGRRMGRRVRSLVAGLAVIAAVDGSALGQQRPAPALQPPTRTPTRVRTVEAQAPPSPGWGKLLPTSWERWQSFDPVQKKRYIETYRRFTQASPAQLSRLRKIDRLRRTSPEVLDRMKRLLPRVREFVQTLSPSQARRLRNMTPQARARAIAQALAAQRLARPTRSGMGTAGPMN